MLAYDGNLVVKETIIHGTESTNRGLRTFSATTNDSRWLEMAVSTTPSGYINIKQHDHKNVWDYTFIERIRLSSESEYIGIYF